MASVIRQVTKKLEYGNSALVLVLPYMKSEYKNNQQQFLDYYDEVEICAEATEAHFKAAIQIRNRLMVDRSNLVVCCIENDSGGAYQTVKYASQKKKNILNVAK